MKPTFYLVAALSLAALFLAARSRRSHPADPPDTLAPQLIQTAAPAAPDDHFVPTRPDRPMAATRSKSEAGRSQAQSGRSAPEVSVRHEPQQPRTGQPVRVVADFTRAATVGEPVVEYQIVDPGRYIALADPAYKKEWQSVPMQPGATLGLAETVRVAELPGTLQKHRRLIRYRIRSRPGDAVVAPSSADAQGNFAYFVYDGLPPWKGAINPRAREAQFRTSVTFPSEALERVPVYHFISSKRAVEKVTWQESNQFGESDRHAYRFTGTMVSDGVVYDHVGFRARGGGWRHAMGKNMWKFNFLPEHRFAARDHYGKRYDSKWDKLNLGACIQQGDYGMRGEQGMFEAVGFRLFNLAGLEASRTHWVHFRIIDQEEESPADQYAGDFWGLYLAVENLDEHFLKEHDLPPGNLYKMEFGAKVAFNGNPAVTDQSDVRAFMSSTMRRQPSEAWWSQNVDLERYFGYRSILECIHHYDIDAGKNYFYYLHPESKKWIVLPWDIDLSWGERMYGGGFEPFYRAGVLSIPTLKARYQERLAEIRDLLFNPEQMGKLIDEYAAMISDPAGHPSLVDADRCKWDYHPVLASQYVMGEKAGQGRFYFGRPQNTFSNMVQYMKSYVARRATWIDAKLLAGYRPPEPPTLAPVNGAAPATGSVRLSLQSSLPDPGTRCQWRLAEVTETNSPAFNPRQPWRYEIQALWEKDSTGAEAEAPGNLLLPGHSYRIRARWQDPEQKWSRWSAPVEVRVPSR